MSFRAKTTLGLIIVQASLLVMLLYVSFTELNNSVQSGVSEKAEMASQLLASLAKDSVLSYDIATLESYTEDIISQKGILYVRIKDTEGNILAQLGDERLLSRAFIPDIELAHVDDGIYDSVAVIDESGDSYGQVELGFNANIIYKEVEETHTRLLFLSAITLLLTIGFAFLLGNHLTKHLNLLIAGANEFSKGNLDYRISIENTGELGATADAFNRMAGQLKIVYATLDKEIGINQAMFMTSPNAIVIIDGKGVINNYNVAAEKLFGYQAEEAIEQNVSVLMDEKEALLHDAFLRKYTEKKDSQIVGKSRELTAKHKNGNIIPIDLTIGEMLVHGEPMFVGIIRDITELTESRNALLSYQKNLESTVRHRTRQLESAKDAAEAGARAKTAFIANMSHEIRTPMNSIIGFAEVLMLDKKINTDSKIHIQTILNSSRSLLTIINDILDISKLESGKFSLENTCFHLRNAVAEILTTIERQAEEKDIKLTLNFSNEIKNKYFGDPTRLRQVILNLVSNSIKFTEHGEVSIFIDSAAGKGLLKFSIKDNGIGMNESQCDKIFESFVQADTSTTRKYGGTGLGTTICKQIVELMNGEIWVESELGEGSTFYFTVQLEEASEDEPCLYAGVSLPENYSSPRTFRILLAEDIKENASLAILRLTAQGHEINWVCNGKEAVKAYQEKDYDIILMDVMMPEMDGLEATEAIRSIEDKQGNYTIPILALTASVMTEDHERCRNSGMDAVESKPINFGRLLAQMESMIPADRGKVNKQQHIDITNHQSIDFSPVLSISTIDKALDTWKDDYQYAKSLKSFAENHCDDAVNTRTFLSDFSDKKNMKAKGVVHNLKGLAGNLYLEQIAKISDEIDDLIKSGNRNMALNLTKDLDEALNVAINAIDKIRLDAISYPLESEKSEPIAIKRLLDQTALAINEYNPDSIEPLLSKLRKYLAEPILRPLEKAVETFDFDQASIALEQLRVHEHEDLGE